MVDNSDDDGGDVVGSDNVITGPLLVLPTCPTDYY